MLLLKILFLLCAFSWSTEKRPRRRNCNAAINKYYDPDKGKCRRCKSCDVGEGRDYSELITLRTGENGHEECFPCRPCPEGSFNDRSYPQCKKCETDCNARHREVRVPCNARADNQCGACLLGYYDDHSDVNLPCKPLHEMANVKTGSSSIQSSTLTPKPNVTTKEMGKVDTTVIIQNGTNLIQSQEEYQTPRVDATQGKEQREDKTAITAGYTVAGCIAGALGVFIGLVLCARKWRRSRRKVPSLPKCDKELEMQIKSTAVQMDSDEGIGTPTSSAQSSTTSLSSITKSKNNEEISNGSSDEGICEDKKRKRCRHKAQSSVEENDLSTDAMPLLPRNTVPVTDKTIYRSTPLEKSNSVIRFVASRLTDEGDALFIALDVPIYEIKQLQQERDKDKFSLKEYIFRVLNRWIEIKAREATLLKLEDCLRNTGYDVNELLQKEFDIRDSPSGER